MVLRLFVHQTVDLVKLSMLRVCHAQNVGSGKKTLRSGKVLRDDPTERWTVVRGNSKGNPSMDSFCFSLRAHEIYAYEAARCWRGALNLSILAGKFKEGHKEGSGGCF